MRYETLLSRNLRLARTMRWAIVASGTTNARGDLAGLEPAEQAEGQRNLCVDGQGRVAAQEHQPQLVVRHDVDERVEVVELGVRVGFHDDRLEPVRRAVPVGARRLAT